MSKSNAAAASVDENDVAAAMPPVKPAPTKPTATAAGRDDIRDDLRAPDGMSRRRKGNIDKFEVPQAALDRFKAAGWTLEFKRHTLMGQEDPSYQVALGENCWEAVTTDEIPGFMPSGHSGAIVRDGLMLMKRPAYLTEEARQEDTAAARGMIRAKEAQLGQTPPGTMTRDHATAAPKVGKSYERMEVPKD